MLASLRIFSHFITLIQRILQENSDIFRKSPAAGKLFYSRRIGHILLVKLFGKEQCMFDRIFGAHVFPVKRVEELLQRQDLAAADKIASEMRAWALSLGATHYCHWFQPLTGATAEKHISFLAPFTGRQLLQGESDASSFPTGGLRQTAYARGYTAWDRTSPAIVKETAAGRVLCIPTVFASCTGDALDMKTPLLRSMEAVDCQARRLLALFGRQVKTVTPMVGAEQEYFLIDRQQYLRRRDLRLCGRTLFGAPAPKGRELENQYYGAIPPRAGAFMQKLNRALWLLGIPAAAQHNEVAPAQHELAPMYAPAQIALDQNQLTMELMRFIARQQGLCCLLHEKPFAHINGSGKHNNWSLQTDTGENLLSPGPDPVQNLQFQLVLACLLQGFDTHADLLRASAAVPGNDQRLGGQEAPPAIVSVYLGSRLESLVEDLMHGRNRGLPGEDSDDRNRTSPLAFTGNKFEFRMVGASDSIAMANTVLNTIAADSFCRAADALQGAADLETACRGYIRRTLLQHRRIIYSGDSYSPGWLRQARERGLPNLQTMPEAVGAMETEKARELFGKFRVFTPTELESRTKVLREGYANRTAIEGRTMVSMALRELLPVVPDPAVQAAARVLQELLAPGPEAVLTGAVVPAMEALRQAVDALEERTARALWPWPDQEALLTDI